MTRASGEKVFQTLVDALPTLQELGIKVQVDEWEVLQHDQWQLQRPSEREGHDVTDRSGFEDFYR